MLSYLALVGVGLLSLCLVVIAFGRASANARIAASDHALLLGLGLVLLPCAAFAYWLEVKTHHRPLAAVTFALVASGLALLGWLVARGLLDVKGAYPRARRVLRGAAALGAGVGAVGVMLVSARGIWADPALRSAVSDVVLGVLIAVLAVLLPVAPRVARGRNVVLGLCFALWGVTLWLLRTEPPVRATVKSVPVIAGAVGLALR